MSLFLQFPALIGLLALAAVPLAVHLLSRAKPALYRFSNVEFLKQVLRVTARFRRPKDWLLLALRTLAVLAIAAAFLSPLLLSKNAPLPGEKRSLVLLIDRSASMAAKEGAASRFEAACAEAGNILASVRPELANIIWIDAEPDSVFPELASNRDFLGEELARANVRPEPAALEAAFEMALRQLRNAGGRAEIHILSDFQASAWKDFAPVVPDNVEVRMVPVAHDDVANIAITSLVPLPAAPVIGQQMIVSCRVANHSDEPRRLSLTLDAGGSRQSQPVDLPPRGEAEAVFTVRCSAAGLLPITAEVDADAFPGDDRRFAVVRVRESLRMAVAAPEADPAGRTMNQVARAISWLQTVPVADTTRPPACDILFFPAWDGTNPQTFRDLAASGTAVIIQATPGCPSASIAALFGDPADPAAAALSLETSDKGWEASPSSTHRAFRLFAGGEFGNPLGGRFLKRVRVGAPPSAILAAAFADGAPALLEAKDRRLMVSNLSLDRSAGSWTDEATFLPGLAEIFLHLMPAGSSESFVIEPGGLLSWTSPSLDGADRPVHEAPDASRATPTVSGDTWQSAAPATLGIHRWLVSDQAVHLTAVNFPDSESILRPLATPPNLGPRSQASGTASRRAAMDDGLPLWPWLVATAMLALILEGGITSLKLSASRVTNR